MKQVIYKDQATLEVKIADVQDSVALQAQQRMGTQAGFYLGNEYIRGTDILKIQDNTKNNQIGAGSVSGKYCSQCEYGWIYGPEGGRPCKCTPKHTEIVKEYRQYLHTQEWYDGN